MSIKDGDGDTIVTLNTIHALAFKVMIWVGILGVPVAANTAYSILRTQDNHEWRLQSLERATHKAGITQSVNVGAVKDVAAEESARTFLTVQEVARREQVTDRTVLNWIEEGKIDPAPMKDGKVWVLSEDYRILPQIAARRKAHNEPEPPPAN